MTPYLAYHIQHKHSTLRDLNGLDPTITTSTPIIVWNTCQLFPLPPLALVSLQHSGAPLHIIRLSETSRIPHNQVSLSALPPNTETGEIVSQSSIN
jgi:hypothetical protein